MTTGEVRPDDEIRPYEAERLAVLPETENRT
jgi:hypothetical protein